MNLRGCSALLVLLAGCATTEPQQKSKQHHQIAIPWAPLVAPRPVVVPAPVGLTPPVTVMVDPGAQPKPEAAPDPDSSRSSRGPPAPVIAERRPECEPIPVPHRGGDDPHNECADRVPPNRYPGKDVLVNGKRFDALQAGILVLWEIKTDRFDTYNEFIQEQAIRKQMPDLIEERNIAASCGYGFVVGVSTEAHRAAILREDIGFVVVVTGCPR